MRHYTLKLLLTHFWFLFGLLAFATGHWAIGAAAVVFSSISSDGWDGE
jgi:hypothetical protein